MAIKKVNVPLKEIVNSEENVYELTNAVIRRAGQLALTGSKSVDSCEGKVVSAALQEVLGHIVGYRVISE